MFAIAVGVTIQDGVGFERLQPPRSYYQLTPKSYLAVYKNEFNGENIILWKMVVRIIRRHAKNSQ